MARLLSCFPLVLIATLACAAPAADSPLSRLLTPEEFARAGLSKLTPAELGALESALAAHGALPRETAPAAEVATPPIATAPAPRPAAASSRETARDFGAEQVTRLKAADTPGELHAHIDGTIQEINGRAVFALDNGQVWQQRIADAHYFPRKLVNPEVVISRGLGGYKMVIVPANCVLFVKRIQ